MSAIGVHTTAIDEGHLFQLVRNALLVAGTELGKDGDHWPVIKATIHQIMRQWEEVKIERNVDAELKLHLYQQLDLMERDLPNCAPEGRASVAQDLKELRETYDAYFAPANLRVNDLTVDDMPISIQRAKAIIKTLEE